MAGILESELHNITPDNVVFCYRQNDSASFEVALHYSNARSIPSDQLIALPCSADNVISENEYLTTIEQPLTTALGGFVGPGSGGGSGGERQIWVLILGHRVPHAYTRDDNGDVIAIASRLHRLGKTSEYKFRNFTYNRIGNWRYFDTDDAAEITITAVIDGPTVAAAKALIDRSLDVDNQSFITGKIFVDPYGKKITEDQLQFQDDILDFVNNEIPNLGLSHKITVDLEDPYLEPQTAFFSRDSFYWGWFTPRFSRDLFLNQNERRVFLYNADDDSAADITLGFDVNGSDPWCNLAINIDPGYASCAGSVSGPDEDAFLRPRPFFEAMHRGATLGECFLFSSPFLNWKIILIGDPLMVVNFPVGVPNDQDLSNILINNNEAIRLVKESLEEAIGYAARQTRLVQELLLFNVDSVNISEEIELLPALAVWRDMKNDTTRRQLFSPVIASWINYIFKTANLTLDEWLTAQGEKISSYLRNSLQFQNQTVSNSNVYAQGRWQYDFVYAHELNTLQNVHFRLQVASDNDFGTVISDINSSEDVTGWKFENEPNKFINLFEFGYPSNFSGFRIRFDAPSAEYLTTTEIYYIRWRVLTEDGDLLVDWTIDPVRFLVKR